jgi:hypothetical protein
MTIERGVLEQVSSELQAYVYMLVDPVTGVPFYVGKGQGLRHAAHVNEALVAVDESLEDRSRKEAKINDLLRHGIEPEVWILRYGLKASEYTAVEAAAIDLLMTLPVKPRGTGEEMVPLGLREQLTNERREDAHGHGMTLLQTLIEEYAAPTLTATVPLLLITLNGWADLPDGEVIAGGRVRYGAGFRSEWLVSSIRRRVYHEIGESASAWWSLSPRSVERRGIRHVAVMHRGVTRALLQIQPGSWEVKTTSRVDKRGRPITKTAFWFRAIEEGPLFDDIVGAYGHRVPGRARGTQNSIYYWPR